MKLRVISLIQALLFCALVCAVTTESSAQVSSLGSVIDESGFALLVDVSDYKDLAISPLKSKSQEVDKIRSALESVGGFPSQQIQLLSNEKATRQAIIEALTTVVERTKNQMNARFLFYLKGRSLKTPGKNYFLPYDARVGAVSTYIEENELMSWFNRVPTRIKAFIWSTWNLDDPNDSAFSTQLATILASEETDADSNRDVILAEIKTRILGLGFRGDYPIRITGDGFAVLVRLSAALEVNSQPPGATVMLNGTEKGMTPSRIVGLTPGTHRIRLKKDLYRMTEEQTVSISTARGERLSPPPYQLTPIKVYGTVRDANGKVLSGVEVQIADTGYKKTVDQEGKFSFENWQSYGLLESGRSYDLVAKSGDGIYNGSLAFTFKGTEDIALDIKLAKGVPLLGRTQEQPAAGQIQQSGQGVSRKRPIFWVLALATVGVIVIVVSGLYLRNRPRLLGKYQEIPNPYIAGKPISDQKMFFGREDVFEFIKDKFSHGTKDITIVLHGGRRTGKTSVLLQIANGRLGEEFVPLFIDMQEMAGVDMHGFFRIIAQRINEMLKTQVELAESDKTRLNELLGRLEDKTKSAYQSFNDFLTQAASTLKGKYLIFLVDEYEIIERKVSEGDLTSDIFTYLRHMMQNFDNLSFIFAGSRDFARRQRREWALMFNIAQPKEVSFLSRDDATALITEPVKDYVRYDKKAIDRILRLTAGQPYFAQAICIPIIDFLNDKKQNRATVERVEEACRDIVENAPYHFTYIWSELTSDEKILISLLAEVISDEMAYAAVDEIASRLSHYNLQYSQADISKTLSRLIEEHLVEKKPEVEAYRFLMDLSRLWIKAEHPTWGVLKELESGN